MQVAKGYVEGSVAKCAPNEPGAACFMKALDIIESPQEELFHASELVLGVARFGKDLSLRFLFATLESQNANPIIPVKLLQESIKQRVLSLEGPHYSGCLLVQNIIPLRFTQNNGRNRDVACWIHALIHQLL